MIFTTLALLALCLTVAALLSSGLTAFTYRGWACMWPFGVAVLGYAVAWLWTPPPPLAGMLAHTGMTPGDLLRYSGVAASLLWLQRDYKHALKHEKVLGDENKLLKAELQAVRSGAHAGG